MGKQEHQNIPTLDIDFFRDKNQKMTRILWPAKVEKFNHQRATFSGFFHLPPELMKEGTWLHFEYREMTEEDGKNGLFAPDEPIICLQLYGPPDGIS